MFAAFRHALIGCALLMFAGLVIAQPAPIPTPKPETPPNRDVVAARVNDQPILELAVFRGLMRVRPNERDEKRKDVLNFLIDNSVIDHYLVQLKIPVDPKDIEEHIQKVKEEAVKDKTTIEKILGDLHINEQELRSELAAALRWDKFVLQQGTDKVLKEVFDRNPEMFNGTRMQARHILIPIKDAKNPDSARAAIAAIKRDVEAEAAKSVAKLPTNIDSITRERERVKALEKAFADAAVKHSTCPSSKDGGDLGFFPRAGAMVEPFARAAFALKAYQMSEPVATDFGYHLILAIDHRPGKEVKFEQVRPFVQEVYGERLREAVLGAYKSKAKIEIMPRR
jgi:peptidyl-prolyl cis-trans isomerase C